MSTEQALRDVLSGAGTQGDEFRNQLESFRNFEEQMERGGYKIQRESFSIPLMDRVAPCVHKLG